MPNSFVVRLSANVRTPSGPREQRLALAIDHPIRREKIALSRGTQVDRTASSCSGHVGARITTRTMGARKQICDLTGIGERTAVRIVPDRFTTRGSRPEIRNWHSPIMAPASMKLPRQAAPRDRSVVAMA
jgi:hypothetical protein